jgi:hypothetical protein
MKTLKSISIGNGTKSYIISLCISICIFLFDDTPCNPQFTPLECVIAEGLLIIFLSFPIWFLVWLLAFARPYESKSSEQASESKNLNSGNEN